MNYSKFLRLSENEKVQIVRDLLKHLNRDSLLRVSVTINAIEDTLRKKKLDRIVSLLTFEIGSIETPIITSADGDFCA
jgi:ribosomal protein L18E